MAGMALGSLGIRLGWSAVRFGVDVMPAGRPSEYDPSFCEKVIELGKEGKSVVQMACAFEVSRPTLEENWTKAHPEFLEAFTLAKQFSQAWWEKGQENLLTPSGVIVLISKGLFGPALWRRDSRTTGAKAPNVYIIISFF